MPNLVLVTCHDLGRHLGCYGVATVNTPRIDRLAVEGLRFARSFAVAPQCSPSRAALFTGRYPHANGVMGLVHAGFKWGLHDGEVHLAQQLADAGFHTAALGIVHEHPTASGLGFGEILQLEDADKQSTAWAMNLAHRAGRFLADPGRGEKPFYLQLGFFEPHRDPTHPTSFAPTAQPARLPATVPAYLVPTPGAAEELAFYEASVRMVDDAMGVVFDALDSAGLADDTIVVFTSDHGVPFPRAKCSLYDPGIEVPLILRWPRGPWRAGSVENALISNVDYVPTLCELLGVTPRGELQGRSCAALLRGEPWQPRQEIFAEMTYHDYYDPLRAIRTDTHKLVVSFDYTKAFMDPTQQWFRKTTTIVPPDPQGARHPLVELYDVVHDPLERDNLADKPEWAALRRSLLARLYRWMKETGDPLLHGVPAAPRYFEALKALQDADAV